MYWSCNFSIPKSKLQVLFSIEFCTCPYENQVGGRCGINSWKSKSTATFQSQKLQLPNLMEICIWGFSTQGCLSPLEGMRGCWDIYVIWHYLLSPSSCWKSEKWGVMPARKLTFPYENWKDSMVGRWDITINELLLNNNFDLTGGVTWVELLLN